MTIPNGNYINIKPQEFDTPIYRVTKVKNLLEMLEFKKITLRRPQLWDDPFENILRRTIVKLKDGTKVGFSGLMNCFYGQCWTLEKESDAMWRIYALCKHGVKIKTTIRKLLEAIYHPNDPNSDRKYFIGKVCYLGQGEIMNILKKLSSLNHATDPTFQSQTLTLLIKRKAFSHEKEIRLIYRSDRELQEDERTFPVDPNKLVEEVVFDPRMNQDSFKYYRDRLLCLGYKEPIEKSTLYDPIIFIKHLHNQ